MILGGKTMFHIVHILKWNQNPNECLGGKKRGGKQLKYEGNNDKKKHHGKQVC